MNAATGHIAIGAIEEPKRKPRKSKSQVRTTKKADMAKKRSGSHDDLLHDDEPRKNRFLLCPTFTSTADLPHHYDTVFDSPPCRKGSGEVKRNFLKSIRSNSLAGLLAVAGNLSSETTELLRDD
ncbi:jg3939 [Pararge aegeria aegeria]|uniref:Jg3939 protein n=1 Tax=Pararge aegeria aegeria TaxID=348720 RepID=A0A8S4S107_9NEOP|nr:jg3939 [Pararge aegeria aegeria]